MSKTNLEKWHAELVKAERGESFWRPEVIRDKIAAILSRIESDEDDEPIILN